MPGSRADPDPEVPDEARLLSGLRADPSRWLPLVLERYEDSLLRYAGAIVGDADSAQDVVQECFLKPLGHGRPIENLPAWLHRVAHNLAVDHRRHEARRQRVHLQAAGGAEPVAEPWEGDLDRRAALDRVQGALARLTPNERAVVFLKVKEGRSYKEISEITGLSTSNVGYLIHQALRKLAARLRPSPSLQEIAR